MLKNWQKQQTVVIRSGTISVLIVVCTIKPSFVTHRLMIPAGTPLYGMRMQPDGTPSDKMILRAGILDDIGFLNEHKPKVEVFTGGRVCWLNPVEEAGQFTGMPPLP
jgi:hypothetical protein